VPYLSASEMRLSLRSAILSVRLLFHIIKSAQLLVYRGRVGKKDLVSKNEECGEKE